jgi:hypothetical protein
VSRAVERGHREGARAGRQTRRSGGTGSIYYSDADSRWEAKLDLGIDPATGRRRTRKVTGRTKAAITRDLAELERASADGVDVGSAPMTVGRLATDWLTKEAAQPQEPSTFSRTKDVVERRIDHAMRRRLVTWKVARVPRAMQGVARRRWRRPKGLTA